MSLSDILKQKNYSLSNFPLPFWKIMLSEDEYKQIKDELRILFLSIPRTYTANELEQVVKRNRSYALDLAIYYSEWYRRFYDGGNDFSEDVIIRSLIGSPLNYNFLSTVIKKLVRSVFDYRFDNRQIELVKVASSRRFSSLLYQGGLPIAFIEKGLTGDGSDNRQKWLDFARKLLSKEHDFQFSPSKAALKSQSYQSFCRCFINAIRQKDLTLLPFNTNSTFWSDHWEILTGQIESAKREYNPFSIKWFVQLDKNTHKISFNFEFNGPKSLVEEYRKSHKLGDDFYLRFEYKEKSVTGEYINNLCLFGFDVEKTAYDGVSEIRIVTNDSQNDCLFKDSLDINMPRIIHLDKNTGRFNIEHKIERNYSYIVLPEGWKISSGVEDESEVYKHKNGVSYTLIPWTFSEQASIKITDGIDVITMGRHSQFKWTELGSPMPSSQIFEEDLYIVGDDMKILVCDGISESESVDLSKVSYRLKHSSRWSATPVLGCTSAKVSSEDDVYIKDSRFFYNMGGDVTVTNHTGILDRDNEALLSFSWECGSIEPVLGTRTGDGWLIKRDDCIGYQSIPVNCVPNDGSDSFDLHLRLPFKEFSVVDSEGNKIKDGALLPLVDLRNYYYKIKNAKGTISVSYYKGGERNTRNCQFDTDNHEEYSSLIGLIDADVSSISDVQFSFSPGLSTEIQNVKFQKEPFYYKCNKAEKTLEVYEGTRFNPGQKAKFYGLIKIISFEDIANPCVIKNEDGVYHLPERVKTFGGSYVIGTRPGLLKPQFEDFSVNEEITEEERLKNYLRNEKRLLENMETQNADGQIWSDCKFWLDIDYRYKIGIRFNRENRKVDHRLIQLNLLKNTELMSKLITYLILTCNNDDDLCEARIKCGQLMENMNFSAEQMLSLRVPAVDFYLGTDVFNSWWNLNRGSGQSLESIWREFMCN